MECLHDVLHDRALWLLSSRYRTGNTPSQSVSSSIPDDFKNVSDQKTGDLPRKSKLVVGGKNVHQDEQFPSHVTVFFSKIFSLWSLPWNAVYLKEFEECLCEGLWYLDCLIRSESLFYQTFTHLGIYWFIFNNHPFLVQIIQIFKNLLYPGIWSRKVGF